ncbi:MAG: T9SS type A sorting domain-containing protein [Clostridia bacterium]|nr:T9SS type A sorting domain-containing protein [Clostridia bacterium]
MKNLLKSVSAIIILLALVSTVTAQNMLLIPDTLMGNNFILTLENHEMQIFPGTATQTMGANGPILGPVLIMEQGEEVSLEVINHLGDSTTMHWHGMHVPAVSDGGPHSVIPPNTSWNPVFTILDKAGTYWYHPHLHARTDKHVSKGIASLIIVKDAEEAALVLPRTYAVDDFPVVIQTKDFDDNNQILVHSNSDDVLMVNATIDPLLEVPAQVVRLRLLNGSSQRVFQLGLSNNTGFYQIASDGGLLSHTNPVNRLRLAPGERAEILLDLTNKQGTDVQLMSYASELPNGMYGATYPGLMTMMTLNGYNPNPMNGNDFVVLNMHVTDPTANPITTIPGNLVTLNPIPESQANITRTLTFTPETMGPNALNGRFLINGQSFQMDSINFNIPLDNIEIWNLINQSPIAHPFHIHDVQFFVLDKNGIAPPASEAGRKDVVLVNAMETVRFIAQFSDFADDEVPFMYHCHMLLHEDEGMMGQFLVTDNSTGYNSNENTSSGFSVVPNPVMDNVLIIRPNNLDLKINKIIFYDESGKAVRQNSIRSTGGQIVLDVSDLKPGLYLLELSGTNGKEVKKVIIQK